jgi:predicted phage tail protein
LILAACLFGVLAGALVIMYGFFVSACFATAGGCTASLDWPLIAAGAVVMGTSVLGLVLASKSGKSSNSNEIPKESTPRNNEGGY